MSEAQRTWACLSGALLGAAAALIAACSAAGAERVDSNGAALATPFANDQPAFDYFLGNGLTNFQAAGIVGNLDQESGVNPSISQSGGGVGRGIAQWSTGGRWDTAKNDNVLAFAAMQGQSETSLTLQLDFIWYELQTFPDYGLAKLRATTNVSDASIEFEDDYEGCVNADFPECAQAQRITYAMGVLNAYGSDPVPGGAGGSSGVGGGAGSASMGGSSGSVSTGGNPGSGGGGAGNAGSNTAGGPSAGGTPSAAGSAGSAGSSSSAGSAGQSAANASTGSSCAFAPATATHGGAFAFGSTLVLLGLTLRGARRRRRS